MRARWSGSGRAVDLYTHVVSTIGDEAVHGDPEPTVPTGLETHCEAHGLLDRST